MNREAVILLRHDLKRIAVAVGQLIEDCDKIAAEIEKEEKKGAKDGQQENVVSV